ncbi:hypothetical protein BD626DRAFT_475264 [Schizophyllum amplum]|uniref:TEA domain-containing protein n=1 Tax=Schizophyllum amplum TaxID=97359 RepID=A0A550CYC8_9AGAR|nr:hypothetical protein BD626DRAFT_475264 [Auriculariopsis ampla]
MDFDAMTVTSMSSDPSSSSSSTEISPSPPPDIEKQEVFDSIFKGRKSWKTLKNGEMVWPPKLEAALIEGLELYVPDDSRETRMLGRFPMRNRFISDHIYNKTGERRTPKQVGSRLQQLRDTCAGRKLHVLLAPCKPIPRPRRGARAHDSFKYTNEFRSDSGSPPCSDASSPPVTPTDSAFTDHQRFGGVGPVIFIDILPTGCSQAYDVPDGGASAACSCCPSSPCSNTLGPRHAPRPIQWIDPTITLVSPRIIAAQSRYVVRLHGTVVFVEQTSLTLKELPEDQNDSGGFLYSTPFVPGFWSTIVQAPDPTEYTVTHEVVEDLDDDCGFPVLFNSTYRFRYPVQDLTIQYSQQGSWKPVVEHMNTPVDSSTLLPLESASSSSLFAGLNPYTNAVDASAAYGWPSHPSSATEMPMFYAGGGFDMASAAAHMNDPARYVI